MVRTVISSLVLLLGCNGAYCQYTPKLEFEVASIKPAPPASGNGIRVFVGCRGGPGTNDPGLFACPNVSLLGLLMDAYKVADYQLSAPDWAMTNRFDLRATLPEGTTREQFRLMLQSLLEDRFKLRVHHETKDIQRHEMRVAGGGPKFKESSPVAPKEDAAVLSGPPKTDKDGYPILRGMSMAIIGDKARAHWPGMTMETLAGMLSGQIGGPVADMTGLTGKYDIDLYWNAVNSLRANAPGADPAALASEPSGPTLQQALQDQLGLRLESKKGPVDFLVVDHAEKFPTEN